MWGAREKSGWGVSWTISKLSASTLTSGRLQARTRGNSAGQRNKGRNILWRNGSLQQKPELDYGMETYARTWREGPRRGWPKASGLVLVRSPLLTRHKWCEFVSFRRLVCRCHVVFIWCYVGLFCFVFIFTLSLKPRPSVQSFFDMQAPRQPHVFLPLFPFVSLEISLFPSIFVPLPFSLCMESTPYVFPSGLCFSTL